MRCMQQRHNAKTQWYHFTAIVIVGMGFFTDAYDLFSISLITKLLSRIYYFDALSEKPGTLPPRIAAVVNGVAFCRTLAGQLFFGWLGDKLGRKRVYGLTLVLMVICSIASGLSFEKSLDGICRTRGEADEFQILALLTSRHIMHKHLTLSIASPVTRPCIHAPIKCESMRAVVDDKNGDGKWGLWAPLVPMQRLWVNQMPIQLRNQ
ncbi:hypothetical protein GOBAR_DD26926 [Gossypium barbadense]|nr:hypothetical protein GOBAR_DD26926 [Gossypium barbadense]